MKKFLGLSLIIAGIAGAFASAGNQGMIAVGLGVAIAGLCMTWAAEK
jgi:hypothetical protein